MGAGLSGSRGSTGCIAFSGNPSWLSGNNSWVRVSSRFISCFISTFIPGDRPGSDSGLAGVLFASCMLVDSAGCRSTLGSQVASSWLSGGKVEGAAC